MNAVQRRLLKVSSGDAVSTYLFSPPKSGFQCALATLEVSLVSRRGPDAELPSEDLDRAALSRFAGQVLTVGQQVAFEVHGYNLLFTVTGLEVADAGRSREASRGVLLPDASLAWEPRPSGGVKVSGQRQLVRTALFKHGDVSFEKLGIGGLDVQFKEMFRRAFHSRLLSPEVCKRLGIKHVKGILLYGPPGTGKTLIARQIGKMLVGKEPKVVNGPEVLNKYVGASEENIRALFKEAEEDQAKNGPNAELHVIIFDEIDAICKSRGSVRDGSGVHDTVVNQLLTKLDGVDALDNVLVIGMTNRKEMLDEALLRQGRLEVHLEIGLPDLEGRKQILRIHTGKARASNHLSPDVDVDELAAKTQNFSGAELEGLVRSATSWALDRVVDLDDLSKPIEEQAICITRADFLRALDEVKPAFGTDEDALEAAAGDAALPAGPSNEAAYRELRALAAACIDAAEGVSLSAVVHGERGAGKTALAARVVREAGFPFAKLVGPETLRGLGEASKGAKLVKVFEDAAKTPLSAIVLDDVERLIEYVFLGPRFSNAILQDLLTCLAKPTQPGKRQLVIVTTSSRRVLQLLGGAQAFTEEHELLPLTESEVPSALAAAKDLSGIDHAAAERVLRPMASTRGVPIKRLMLLLRLAADAAGEDTKHVPATIYERLVNHARILPPQEEELVPL